MLVNTIDRMKQLVPVIVGAEFGKYETFLNEADEWLKAEITGTALFGLLETEGNEHLLAHCQSVVANKAYLSGIPFFDLVETEAGFAVTRTDTKAPASPERVKALKAGVEAWLSDAIERLLEYLEQNSTYHEAWKSSQTYSLLTETYIHTLREFRRFAPFEGTRMDFIKALPAMLDVIHLKIEPVISPDLSDEIIEELRDNDLTEGNEAILRNIRFAYANFVVGNENTALSYLARVRKALLSSPETYPAFADSDLYAQILATTIEKNNIEKPIFRAGF
jgi:hypothetical protein